MERFVVRRRPVKYVWGERTGWACPYCYEEMETLGWVEELSGKPILGKWSVVVKGQRHCCRCGQLIDWDFPEMREKWEVFSP